MLFKRKENLTKNKQKQTTEKHPTPIKSTSNLNLINNKFYKAPVSKHKSKITQPGLLLWFHKFKYMKAMEV